MVRTTQWMGMLLVACTSVGCAQFYDDIDRCCYELQCSHRAKTAWMEARDLYAHVAYPFNFGEGFRDGYRAVCMGDEHGCPPAMPPRRYWSTCYLNCEGKAKAMAWYDGYAHGVLAASCSGCAGHGQIASGSAAGTGVLGSALIGYRPPMPSNYGARPFETPPDIPDSERIMPYGPSPAPEFGSPSFPDDDPFGIPFPDDDGQFIPEPPGAPEPPFQFPHNRPTPQDPSADAYRVPVF